MTITSTPLRLANHQRVDLRTKFESGLDELAAALKEYIGIKQEIATQTHAVMKEKSAPAAHELEEDRRARPVRAGRIDGDRRVFAVINRLNNENTDPCRGNHASRCRPDNH
jgi:hypothetical protein